MKPLHYKSLWNKNETFAAQNSLYFLVKILSLEISPHYHPVHPSNSIATR